MTVTIDSTTSTLIVSAIPKNHQKVTDLLAKMDMAGMAVGLAAIYPDFNEDNPSKIVNGVGGIINFFLSIAYTVMVVLLIAAPHHLHVSGRMEQETLSIIELASLAAVMVLSAAATALPLLLGSRKFQRFEF